jgi:hypothetical protein
MLLEVKDGGVKNLTYQAKTADELLKPNHNNNRGGFGLPKRCETRVTGPQGHQSGRGG